MGLISLSLRTKYMYDLAPILRQNLQYCFECIHRIKEILSPLKATVLENETKMLAIELEKLEIQQNIFEITEKESNVILQKYIEANEIFEQYLEWIKTYSLKLHQLLKRKEIKSFLIENESSPLKEQYETLRNRENQLEELILKLQPRIEENKSAIKAYEKSVEEALTKPLPTFKFQN